MLLKKITRLLGIAAIGLMMGSSVNYAVKGYGLLGATGDWAKLIASSIASSSSSSSSNEIDCSKYDLTKYTCGAREAWKTEVKNLEIDGSGQASTSLSRFIITVTHAIAGSSVQVSITIPECADDNRNVCTKAFVMDNKPSFTTSGGQASIK